VCQDEPREIPVLHDHKQPLRKPTCGLAKVYGDLDVEARTVVGQGVREALSPTHGNGDDPSSPVTLVFAFPFNLPFPFLWICFPAGVRTYFHDTM
jgi:hypothetical protein